MAIGPFARSLRQQLTYWPPAGRDDFAGLSFGSPVIISGRWVVSEKQLTKSDGEEYTSTAQVMVGQDVAINGYLALGDQRTSANPASANNAWKIQEFTSAADVRFIEQARIAFL